LGPSANSISVFSFVNRCVSAMNGAVSRLASLLFRLFSLCQRAPCWRLLRFAFCGAFAQAHRSRNTFRPPSSGAAILIIVIAITFLSSCLLFLLMIGVFLLCTHLFFALPLSGISPMPLSALRSLLPRLAIMTCYCCCFFSLACAFYITMLKFSL